MAIGETGQATGAESIGYRDACGHVGPGRMVALGQGMAQAVRTVALCALSQAVRTVARAVRMSEGMSERSDMKPLRRALVSRSASPLRGLCLGLRV